MKEIGGYIEFEHFHEKMLHEDGIKLNCGRNCLAYLIKSKNITKIKLPYFLCDCIEKTCEKNKVKIEYYNVGYDFLPTDIKLEDNEWLYVVNFYGQLSDEYITEIKKQYDRIIIDNSHSYFSNPIKGIDTLYTCRKYFGVPDGGILFTNKEISIDIIDESYNKLFFLAGRFEKSANAFFEDSKRNEEHFYNEPIKKMSLITENILRSIDYDFVKSRRTENYMRYHDELKEYNVLQPRVTEGSFMYPLMIENAQEIRKQLINKKIYIPMLWPNVLDSVPINSIEWKLANNILPLPVDQRYDCDDISYVADCIKELIISTSK